MTKANANAAANAQEQQAAQQPAAQNMQPASGAGTWKCECGAENTGKFCSECGASLVVQKKKCIKCGAEINADMKFCPECGHKNASYGKWKAEAEAAEAARRAAKEAEQAEREARKAAQSASVAYETTAEPVSDEAEENVFPSDATACDGEDAQ